MKRYISSLTSTLMLLSGLSLANAQLIEPPPLLHPRVYLGQAALKTLGECVEGVKEGWYPLSGVLARVPHTNNGRGKHVPYWDVVWTVRLGEEVELDLVGRLRIEGGGPSPSELHLEEGVVKVAYSEIRFGDGSSCATSRPYRVGYISPPYAPPAPTPMPLPPLMPPPDDLPGR